MRQAVLFIASIIAFFTPAFGLDRIDESWLDALEWREIGPANMGGRVTSLAVYEADPSIFYVGTASGGLLKTINNGVTFEHQFDDQSVVSIGDVAVFQQDPDIVWIGTGESNPRNSVTWGNGIYRSTDGGETWTHCGLENSFQTGRVVLHPTNPDIAYVGALGRLWGPNEERGLYRTTDAGKSWEKIHYIDEDTGVIDIQMHPEDPDTLMFATWERRRDGFDTNDPAVKWSETTGLYRTTDGGETFEELTEGLPTSDLGRMYIEYYRADPNVVFLMVDCAEIGTGGSDNSAYMGVTGENAETGARLTRVVADGPSYEAGLRDDDIVLRADGKTVLSYEQLVDIIRSHAAGDTITVEVARGGEAKSFEVTFGAREQDQEGKPHLDFLGGQAANVQDQQGPDGHLYGGIYRSDDGGDSWTRINSYNPRPMYFSHMRVDPTDDQIMFISGVQFAKSMDGGETITLDAGRGVHADQHAIWINPNKPEHVILGCDGGLYVSYDRGEHWDHLNHMAMGQLYHAGVDTRSLYYVYGGLQDNGSWGAPNRARSSSGLLNEDWFRIGGGDGFLCLVDPEDPDIVYYESQNGGMARTNLRTGRRAGIRPVSEEGMRFRFNWRTPYMLSYHNPRIYYTAGTHVFRSLDRGNDLRRISDGIARTDRGTATAIDQSHHDPDILYVGTDDGAFHMTTDGGHTWTDVMNPPQPESEAEEAPTQALSADQERIFNALLKTRDKNEDGLLQFDELTGEMAALSGELDADADGALNASELANLWNREAESASSHPLVGTWKGETIAEGIPENQRTFTFTIEEKDGEFGGALKSPLLVTDLADVSLDDGLLAFTVDGTDMQIGVLRFEGRVDGERVEGTIAAGGQEIADFVAELDAPKTDVAASESTPSTSGALGDMLPEPFYVSTIETSEHEEGRVYVSFDGHRSNDGRPWMFVSEDDGETWESIRGDLPDEAGSVRILREDIHNEDLLYAGCEFGAWVSVDRGEHWTSLNGELPTVAIHEIAQHEHSGDVIFATHGRSIWVLDVTPLRQVDDVVLAEDVHLFEPADVIYWRSEPERGSSGARRFVGSSPRTNATIFYSLNTSAGDVSLEIRTLDGETVREIEVTEKSPGLHKIDWNLRRTGRGGRVSPGTYRVALKVDDTEYTRDIEVRLDPVDASIAATQLEQEQAESSMQETDEEGEPMPASTPVMEPIGD